MLRKLVINNWVHVSSELVLEDGKMSCTSLEGGVVGRWVQMQENGVTMCDCLIETVKYI